MGATASTITIQVSDVDQYYFNLSGCTITKTEERGITIRQLELVMTEITARCEAEEWMDYNNNKLTPDQVNLYTVNEKIIMPRTEKEKCSFVEKISTDVQPPRWFVSHWWGEPVQSMIYCLKQHAEDRALDHDTPYWICAYANNQWTLGGEISADPEESSFRKAMQICEGTVSVVDERCETYKRIWCLFELFISTTKSRDDYKLDMYTEMHYTDSEGKKRDSLGITDGLIKSDKEKDWMKTARENDFPQDRVLQAINLDVTKSNASREEDLRHIKNAITGQPIESIPAVEHNNYNNLNNYLRGRFLEGKFSNLISDNNNKDLVCDILKKSKITTLSWFVYELDLVKQVSESFPETIKNIEFTLGNGDVPSNGDEESLLLLFSFINNFPSLESLSVNMRSLEVIDIEKLFNIFILAFTNGHPSLKSLRIDFPKHENKFGNESQAKVIIELLSKFPKLEKVVLGFELSKEAEQYLYDTINEIKNIIDYIFY